MHPLLLLERTAKGEGDAGLADMPLPRICRPVIHSLFSLHCWFVPFIRCRLHLWRPLPMPSPPPFGYLAILIVP